MSNLPVELREGALYLCGVIPSGDRWGAPPTDVPVFLQQLSEP